MATLALAHRSSIKTAVGIGLAKNSTPIVIVRRFLDKIDCKLKYLRAESLNTQKRIRVYQIVIPEDNREQVFYNWIKQDCNRPGSSLFWDETQFKLKQFDTKENTDSSYLQFSLQLKMED